MYERLQKIINSVEEEDQQKKEVIDNAFSPMYSSAFNYKEQCEDFFKCDEEYVALEQEKKSVENRIMRTILLGAPVGTFLSISGTEIFIAPETFDALYYLSYGFMGFIGGAISSLALCLNKKSENEFKGVKDKYNKKVNEVIENLGANTFILKSNQIQNIEIITSILKENSYIKDFLFKNPELEIHDFSSASKYKACNLFVKKSWSKEAKLVFLMEYLKAVKKYNH